MPVCQLRAVSKAPQVLEGLPFKSHSLPTSVASAVQPKEKQVHVEITRHKQLLQNLLVLGNAPSGRVCQAWGCFPAVQVLNGLPSQDVVPKSLIAG